MPRFITHGTPQDFVRKRGSDGNDSSGIPRARASVSPQAVVMVGPLRWKELHGRPSLPALDLSAESAWLAGPFARSLPCGACRNHWLSMLRDSPPDLRSRQAYLAWTVARHNEVDIRLGKPTLSIEDAAAMHDLCIRLTRSV